ncbi:MAG: MazG nucleotide pyrophosphohydrolase domain-containing protein, partial [Eubacteriales bacterium]
MKKYLSTENKVFDLEDLKTIIACLRGEGGCPWDKKQTFETMKECLKNESEEVFEAVDHGDMENLCEELGDVLLQIVMNSQIAKESDFFTMDDVIQGVSE